MRSFSERVHAECMRFAGYPRETDHAAIAPLTSTTVRRMRDSVKFGILILAYIAVGWWAFSRAPGVLGRDAGGLMFSKRATVRIPEAAYTATVDVARTAAERTQGLSGRDLLPDDGGMLLIFDILDQHRIWMKDMRFSIDLIWIASGVVVDTHERLTVPAPDTPLHLLPFFNPRPQALLVVEVPAGTVTRYGIVPGHRVEVTFDGG